MYVCAYIECRHYTPHSVHHVNTIEGDGCQGDIFGAGMSAVLLHSRHDTGEGGPAGRGCSCSQETRRWPPTKSMSAEVGITSGETTLLHS